MTRLEILESPWAVAREVGLGELTLREVADRDLLPYADCIPRGLEGESFRRE